MRGATSRTSLPWLLCVAALLALLPVTVSTVSTLDILAPAHADELTVGSDSLRTGWDDVEPGLSPSSVQSADFGQIFNTTVSGSVYGQPLVSGSTVLVTTEKAIGYGIDKNTGKVLWQRNFGAPFQSTTVGCGDLTPDLGSTATGVVDPSTNTYYVTTKLAVGSQGQWWLQGVSVADGSERPGFPVLITGSPTNDPGNHPFTPTTELQRPGLLLLGGAVYLAFGAHCDKTPYKGYVVGVSTALGSITGFWSAVVGPSSGAGIWQSGGGLMSDGPGRIFLTTGNGFFGATAAGTPGFLGESVVRLDVGPTGTLTTADSFTPANAPALDQNDTDLGSGAPMGLPDGFGTPAHPHLLVQIGKDGRLFLLDRDALGGYSGPTGPDKVVSVTSNVGGVWGSPAFFGGGGGYVYLSPANRALTAFAYGVDGNGTPRLAAVASSSGSFGYTSGSPVVTSVGTDPTSATLWQVYSPGPTGAGGQLRAYAAAPTGQVLQLLWQQPIGTVSKFSVPATDGGRVYVGTRDGHVYAFGRPQQAALTYTPLDLGDVAVSQTGNGVVTATATTAVTVTGVDVTSPFAVSAPALPRVLATGDQLALPVSVTPGTPGDLTGQLTLTTSAGRFVIGLHAFGTAPGLLAMPAALDFGQQPTGLPATRDLLIQNTGTTATTVTSVTSLSGPFALIGAPPVGSVIQPGGSTTVGVSFTPTDLGADSAVLTVTSTTGSVAVPISGTGVQGSGLLSLSPTTLNFGAVVVGQSATAGFTVSNQGNLPLTITKAKAPSGAFFATSPLPEGLVITDSVLTQEVTFAPPSPGPFSAVYSITGDDGRGPQLVTLTGTGVSGGSTFAVTPTRLLDTRRGSGPVRGGQSVHVPVLGRAGVPSSGVGAVVLNVTATGGTSGGNVVAYAGGAVPPSTSNLNFVAGQTVPNLVLAPVGADGTVDLLVRSTGSVQLVADLTGYVVSGPPAVGGVGIVSPVRLLDTRTGPARPVSGGHQVSIPVLGRGGIPASGVGAVVLNVTATGATRGGNVVAYADGGAVPAASNLNFVAGQTVPNLVLAPVGTDGKVDLFVRSTGSVHLVADVSGYVVSGQPLAGGAVRPVAPSRLLDTRQAGGHPVGGGRFVQVQVLGRSGVPRSGVDAVVLNVTATGASRSGSLVVYADGGAVPAASNLNFVAGQTVPNLVLARVGADGKVDVFVRSTGSVHVVVDVFGYTTS
jgi:hypothetical protein